MSCTQETHDIVDDDNDDDGDDDDSTKQRLLAIATRNTTKTIINTTRYGQLYIFTNVYV